MPVTIEHVSIFCFGASYALALGLEVWYLLRPRPILRVLSLVLGCAGILAHTIFVLVQPLLLAAPFGSLLFLGWILAVFYLYGSLHHHHIAWGVFVLPLVLGLTLLAALTAPGGAERGSLWEMLAGERFWGPLHGLLVLLAAVGGCVGFIASLMYLMQVRRLRQKLPPNQGLKLLSLERLEEMNRRAITCAFPLLTAGLLVGVALAVQSDDWLSWNNPKVHSIVALWLVFAILLYLRYAAHVAGRQLALWTIAAFGLLLVSLATGHPGGAP